MAQVKDVARITRSGRPLPDVSTNELPVNAWLVWETAKNKVLAGKTIERRQHEGIDGYVWHGAMTAIFRELWTGMLDSYTGDKNQAADAKRKLNVYLRATLNMVCIDRGQQSPLPNARQGNRPPTYWVRAEWNDAPPPPVQAQSVVPTYTERKLTPHEAGEDRVPEPVTVTQVVPRPSELPATSLTRKKPVICPDCNQSFTDDRYLQQHRSARHPEDAETPTMTFKCPLCDRVLSSSQGLSTHKSAHRTSDAIVRAAAALLEARGTFNNDELVAASNGAIKHFTSLYTHFRSKQELIDVATELLRREGRTVKGGSVKPTEVNVPVTIDTKTDHITLDETARRLLLIISFAAKIDSPVSVSSAKHLVVEASPDIRNDALELLIDTGKVMIERRHTVNSRPYDAVIPANAADVVASVSTDDPITALEAFLADYRRLRSQSDRSADVVESYRLARSEAEKRADEAETELNELRQKLRSLTSLIQGI